MKKRFVVAGLGLLMLFSSGAAKAEGCISGAAVGAVAGHVAGHHAVIGAVAGCAINHHRHKVMNERARAERVAAAQTGQASAPQPTVQPQPR